MVLSVNYLRRSALPARADIRQGSGYVSLAPGAALEDLRAVVVPKIANKLDEAQTACLKSARR